MLSELAVHDLGVVADLHLVFSDGMTVLTGETGAGKTMIVEALALLSGARAEAGLVRDGADEAVVEGRFAGRDGEIVVTRVIPASGRSRAYVNGRMATASSLAELMAGQVDLHAQHAQQSLLNLAGQRAALDRFAEIDLGPLVEARSWLRSIDAALTDLGGEPGVRDREIALLRFELDEFDRASVLDADEDDRLADEQLKLGDVVAHRERGDQTLGHLSGDQGASDRLGNAIGALGVDEVFEPQRDRLVAIAAELDDVIVDLRGVVESIVEDPERLEVVNERRRELAALRRRHGQESLRGLIDHFRGLQARYDALTGADERVEALRVDKDKAQRRVAEVAAEIGRARRNAARRFARAVESELRALAMPAAVFEVGVGSADPGDDLVMRFSANPGMAPAPLSKVASGGELARAMLAVRLVATSDQDTVVFDEVDAGIGGTAAVAVGSALARVAESRQVVVVTHLAQVAAAAHTQIGVTKDVVDGSTVMRAEVLHGEGRVVELSRMMSGRPDSDAAQAHARELLSEGVTSDV